jgi:hypothetical protein
MLASLPRPTDFIFFGSRGLFAYDWTDVHRNSGFSRRYEMLSKPERPIHCSNMPERFQELLRATTFSGLRFADTPKIDVREHFVCEPAA